MVRICMVAYTYYPTDSRVRREAEALVDRGDRVEVISLRRHNSEPIGVLNGVRLIQLSVVRYRGSRHIAYLVNYCLFFLAASVTLVRLHLRNRYQVIQVHTMPDFMVFVALVPRLMGAKVILDVHDLMPELYQSKFGLYATHWLVRAIAWVERSSIAFADRAIAVHQPHLDALVRRNNPAEKFTVLLNLPDPKIFDNQSCAVGREDSDFKLLYHGTVAERYGLQVALRAVSSLKNEIAGLKLEIVGEGQGIAGLIALSRELDLNGSVSIREGWSPLEQLVPVICGADVGIVPILCDAFTRYMLPTKLLEYVAMGKPVICSRSATIEAYFDDSMVQYSTPGDAAELAEQIRFLYRNPGRREQLRTNADRFNREYSWERQKQLYYATIDGLVRGQ